jgi:hypothetical protein
VIRCRRDSIEVSMLVPLRVGLPVEIERPAELRGPNVTSEPMRAARPPQPIRAQVTGCRCHADGLFRISLTYEDIG